MLGAVPPHRAVRADLADASALAVTDLRSGVLSMPASFRADRAVGWNRPEHVVRSRSAKARAASRARAHARARAAKVKAARAKASRKSRH